MANGVDPRLSLAVQPFDTSRTFNNLLSNIGQVQQMERQAQLAPIQLQSAQLGLQQAQREEAQRAQLGRLQSVALGASEILPDLLEDNPQAALQKLQARRQRLVEQGVPTMDTDQAIQMLATPEGQLQLTQDAENAVALGQQLGVFGRGQGLTAEQRNRQELLRIAEDSNATKIQRESALIELGVKPRAVGSALQTIAETGTAEQVGETSATIRQREKFGELTGASRAKAIDKGFDTVSKITTNIRNIDRAIKALDDGAKTGAVQRFFPSIRAASKELEQIRNELALDVIGSVTFGALSEGELQLAQETALPTGLDEPALRDFLNRKRTAQEKLRGYYEEQIEFLDQGGTIPGFLREKRRQRETIVTPQGAVEVSSEVTSDQQGFNSRVLGRTVTEQDIQETLANNPGLTRQQLFIELGINDG